MMIISKKIILSSILLFLITLINSNIEFNLFLPLSETLSFLKEI